MLLSWIEISRVWYRRWIWKIIWYVPKLLPGSNPGTFYTSATHSDQQQEVPDTPGSGIWTCRSRVVRMQPSEYIKKTSGVRKSKYTCTENKWTYVKTVYVCMESCSNPINESIYIIHQWYMYNANVCKTNCINSISGSMRLVHRGDNPISHFTINWVYT